MYYAAEQANRLGLPLNTHVTINFSMTRCPPWAAVQAFARLRTSFHHKWATRLGRGLRHQPTAFYAFENTRDGIAFMAVGPGLDHNVHVHWAVHVPEAARFDFEMQLAAWVDAVAGDALPGAVLVQYPDNPSPLWRYLRKGTTAAGGKLYGNEVKPQGKIVGGRRSGTTRNLGRSARIAEDRRRDVNRKRNLVAAWHRGGRGHEARV